MAPITIHTLPTEILGAIFASGCGQRCEHARTFEVLVSHVSKRWREVALNTVTLWSGISIRGHHRNSWVPYYLERSKGSALDIRLDFWQLDSGSISPEEQVASVVSLFTPHAGRLRNVNIKTYREETLSLVLLQFQDVSMPHLRRFSVMTEEETGDCEDIPGLTTDKIMRGYTPRLEALHVDAAHVSWMPLSGVKELNLYGAWGGSLKLTLDEFINVITAPQELTTLIVQGNLIDSSSWPLPEPLSPIHLPHLRSLRVSSQVSFIYEVLSCLSAPLLESAWFDLVPTNSIQRLTSVDGVSFPSVRNLAFHTTASCEQLDCHKLTGISQAFSGVTSLSVTCFGKFCPVIEHLEALDRMAGVSVSPNTRHLFPDLKAIAVRGSPVGKTGRQVYDLANWRTVLVEKIYGAAWARKQLGCPLEKVQVEGGWMGADLEGRLSGLVSVEKVRAMNPAEALL